MFENQRIIMLTTVDIAGRNNRIKKSHKICRIISRLGIYGILWFANLFFNLYQQGYQQVFNRKTRGMLISTESVNGLVLKSRNNSEIFCEGLFLSARWFVVSQYDYDGVQLIVLPDRESAEYCAADLYNLIEGDKVFYLPHSGKNLERSNYKSTLGVQRTSAIGQIISHKEDTLIVVTISSKGSGMYQSLYI